MFVYVYAPGNLCMHFDVAPYVICKIRLTPCIKKLLNSGGEGEGMMSYFGNVVLEFGFFHTIKSHSFTDKPISI